MYRAVIDTTKFKIEVVKMITANSRHTHPLIMSFLDRQFVQSMRLNPNWKPGTSCDWDSQNSSEEYQQTLKVNGIPCSMNRKGDCWNNIVIERFFAIFEQELFHRQKYKTRASARYKFFEYNEVFNNRKRLYSFLRSQRLEMIGQAL